LTRGPENDNGSVKFTIANAKAGTSGGSTTCTISQVVVKGPAAMKRRRRGIIAEEEEEDGAWEGLLWDAACQTKIVEFAK